MTCLLTSDKVYDIFMMYFISVKFHLDATDRRINMQ